MSKLRMLGIAVLLATVVGACSSGGGGSDAGGPSGGSGGNGAKTATVLPDDIVLAAAKSVDVAPTGRFSVAATVGTGKAATFRVEGSFDRAAKAVQVDVLVGSSDEADLGTLTVDGVLYVKLGEGAKVLGVKTPWVSMDVGSFVAKQAEKLPTAGPGATGGDPQSFLDLLKGVSGSVTKVGTETVRGTSTTHYKAKIVPAKALADLPADRQEKIRAAIGDSPLDTPIPVDVWIDGDGQFRKGTFHEDLDRIGPVSSTVEYYDIGEPVTIDVPASAQVTKVEDIPALKGLLGGK